MRTWLVGVDFTAIAVLLARCIAVERLKRTAAPTKLPDSTTCRKTFMLSRVSIRESARLMRQPMLVCAR